MAGKVFFSVTMSLDGFIAPGSLGDLMGRQWMELQQWIFPLRLPGPARRPLMTSRRFPRASLCPLAVACPDGKMARSSDLAGIWLFGRGKREARRAAGFGMRVVHHTLYLSENRGVQQRATKQKHRETQAENEPTHKASVLNFYFFSACGRS